MGDPIKRGPNGNDTGVTTPKWYVRRTPKEVEPPVVRPTAPAHNLTETGGAMNDRSVSGPAAGSPPLTPVQAAAVVRAAMMAMCAGRRLEAHSELVALEALDVLETAVR